MDIHEAAGQPTKTSLSRSPILLTIVVGLAVSGALYALTARLDEYRIRAIFEQESEDIARAVQVKLQRNVNQLEALAAFFETSEEVTRAEFRAFTREIRKNHPDVLRFEWVPYVAHGRRSRMEAAARAEGIPGFQFRDSDPSGGGRIPAATRSEYYPIYYVEPQGQHVALLGHDLAFDPFRWPVLEAARDSGRIAASPPFRILRDSDLANTGVLIALPVSRRSLAGKTAENRIAAPRGFVVAVFRVEDSVRSAVPDLARRNISVVVDDQSAPAGQGLLYASDPGWQSAPTTGLEWMTKYSLGNRESRLTVRATPVFLRAHRSHEPWVALVAGLAVTLILTGFVRARLRQAELLTRGDRALSASLAHTQRVIEAALDGIIVIDKGGRILGWNPAAEVIFGWPTAEVMGGTIEETIIPPSLRDSHRRGLERYLATGEAAVLGRQMELTAVNRDGREFPIELAVIATGSKSEPTFTAFLRDITEERQARLLLEESEKRFRDMVQVSADWIWEVDAAGRYAFVSDSVTEILGYTPDEILGRTPFDLMPPEEGARVRAVFEGILSRREAFRDLDNANLRKDGVIRHILTCGVPILDADGTFRGYRGMDRDVTERRQHEEAILRLNVELEDRVRQRTAEVTDLYNNAPCGYHSLDADGVFVHINDTELHWLGYTRDEVVGQMRFADLITDASRETFRRSFPTFKTRGWIRDLEFDMIRKDGSSFPVLLSATAVMDAAGKFVMSRSTLFDIAARKQAERALAERGAQLQAFLDAASDLILRVKKDGSIFYTNRTCTERLARPGVGLVGGNLCALIVPELRNAFQAALQGVLESGRSERVETILLGKYAQPINAEGGIYPRVEAGVVDGADLLLHDVTARHQTEEALRKGRDEFRQVNAELQRAAHLKDDFLANMSHELRTPLNAVLGLAEALQEEVYGPLVAKQRGALQHIEESGRHLLGLINDILDLSKVEAGKLELEPAPVEVEGCCQASLQFIREAALKKQQEVALKLDPAIPSLVADARRLKQILVNLLSNAVKFTPAGGTVGLEVAGDRERAAVRFTVWDTGIGIAAEDVGRLFEPFFQVDSSLARQYQGTGLGLPLVSRLAALHGGSVEFESTPGQGSRFTVWLPWRVPAGTPLAPQAGSSRTAGEDGCGITSALVVEDIALHAEQIVRYLQELGVQATISPQGGGVVEQAAAERPDIILLDLGLPDVSGWTVLAALQDDPRTRAIPVVVVTVADERARALAAGAAEFLCKPCTRAQFQAVVRMLASDREASRALLVLPSDPPEEPLLLLAEDNPINVSAFSEYLQAKGYRLVVAGDGLQALELAQKERPALILMDVQMPGMDGLEATRRLRADPDAALAATPIIALTALAMRGDRERCLAAGATAYLAKPVRLKELAQSIAGLLGRECA